MSSPSMIAVNCPERERLEDAFREARDRYRALRRLRQLTVLEERQLADRVAMAIAHLKEHDTKHGCGAMEGTSFHSP